MQFRTDLAIEVADEAQHLTDEDVGKDAFREGDTCVTRLHIRTDRAARALDKPKGAYITVEVPPLTDNEETLGKAAGLVANELTALLPAEGSVLVVGLGNRAITPDNIGPKAADQTMVTRHLVERVPEHFGSFRPVAALAAGVLGTTGMESGEVVRAVAEQIKPACVVAVDALASRSLRRVCRTIQLADTGITPGSGVGNARAALNAETLGVPVIAVGVPTVVDAATLTCDVLAEAGKGELNPAALQGAGDGLIVTPKDIDTQVHDLAKVIGYGINLALHTGLTIGDVELFLS